MEHHFFDLIDRYTTQQNTLPAEQDVHISMKASDTWSHDSHSLIVVAFVAVVDEVGCGVVVGGVRMRTYAAGRQRVPGAVV